MIWLRVQATQPTGRLSSVSAAGSAGGLYLSFQLPFWGGGGAFGLHFGELVGFPVGAALLEDAGEELVGGFVVAAFGAGEFGFGGNEVSFAGGLQHGRPVALQVRLGPLERRHPRIQSRELLLDLGDDSILFRQGR